MTQPTLGLLEKLRPPPGFRTLAALGTTYSIDLLACMAVLTTMDGGDGEQIRYGRVAAFRALDRLRDRVRVCYQAGCLSKRDGLKYPSVTLLDRILVPIRLPGRGSFHPKVWLVRQTDEEHVERFVLIVSSRNVKASTDWDLGLALEGRLGGNGIALPRLRAFATHALSLAGDPGRLASLGSLDDVRWNMPPHVQDLVFDFQAGGESSRLLHGEWRSFIAKPKRALLLSPFIDAAMVQEVSRRWGQVPERRLVAGTEDLLSVAVSQQRRALEALNPYQMVAADETANPQEEQRDESDDDEVELTRALHAKVIAIDDGRRAMLVVGSNNLTSMGWRGGSTEAFVRLVGAPTLCEPLWDWARTHALTFELPDPSAATAKPGPLEAARDALQEVLFRLQDSGSEASSSRLRLVCPSKLNLPEGIRLDVARYTTPRDAVPFPNGSDAVDLPGCAPAFRTRFVVCTLRLGEVPPAEWIAMADLDPPIDDARDRELVANLLGFHQFMAYLQSLGPDQSITEPGEGDPNRATPASHQVSDASGESVSLEGLLKQLVSNPRAFEELDRTIVRYGELIKQGQLSGDEQMMLTRFLEAWSAIRKAFDK